MDTPGSQFVEDLVWQESLKSGGIFLDVRAEIEFIEGAIPGAVNLPILNTTERHLVGIRYKESGSDAAYALGHEMVRDSKKTERVDGWVEFLKKNPKTYLYCFRGGMRSQIAQQWIMDAGVSIPRVKGGYKEIRNFLLKSLKEKSSTLPLSGITGYTGSGKTRLLRDLKAQTIDLEGLANHRGSAFGSEIDPQPSQATFENRLAITLLKIRPSSEGKGPVWFEDEARMIGKVCVPDVFYNPMMETPLYVISEPIEARAKLTLEDYVIDRHEQLRRSGVESPLHLMRDLYLNAIERISKKLGGTRTLEAQKLIGAAFQDHSDWHGHLNWIKFLLKNYYDPLYERHLERQKSRIKWTGTREELKTLAMALVKTDFIP